jgi:hypothetical protein
MGRWAWHLPDAAVAATLGSASFGFAIRFPLVADSLRRRMWRAADSFGRSTARRKSDVGGVTSAFAQVLSDDAVYEYRADRWWAEGPRVVFVGCNPSLITWQAGARLDPTSANCEAIARRDGYAGVTMLNLWALRSTDPRQLRDHPDPVGPGWAEAFDEAVRDAAFVVVAWGTAPSGATTRVAQPRIAEVVDHLVERGLELRCLGQTKDGEPRHASLRRIARDGLPALQPFVNGRSRP